MEEASRLTEFDPYLLKMVNDDLDAAALAQKAQRKADLEWEAGRGREGDWLIEDLGKSQEPRCALELAHGEGGRPRTPAMIVFVGLFLRGQYGSLTSAPVRDRLADSASFQALQWKHGTRRVAPTTLASHVNNISAETIKRMHDAQLRMYKEEELDDFKIFLADSTSVRANSQWPRDSMLIYMLLRRADRILTHFEKLGLCSIRRGWVPRWLERLRKTAQQIDMCRGKKNAAKRRRKLYRDLLGTSQKSIRKLEAIWVDVELTVAQHPLKPSKDHLRQQAMKLFEQSILDATSLISVAERRTQRDEEVKREDHEMIYSVYDPDAVLLYKRGSQTNFGYKPQLAFSWNGFVTAAVVEKGSIADVSSMIPLLEQSIERTGVVPTIGSVDDGYSSKENWRHAIEERGLDVMSMSGAKGKRAIGDTLYESEDYIDARRMRGKAEFPIFVLKHVHDMARMKRTGLSAVRREIFEKILTSNAARAIQLRRQAADDEADRRLLRLTG